MLYKLKMSKNPSMLKETLNKNDKRFSLGFQRKNWLFLSCRTLYLNRTFSLEVQLEKSEIVEKK